MSTLWEGRPAQSEDDCFRSYSPSQFSLTTSSLYVGHADADYGCAMRYPNVLVPAGKVIDSAVLYVRCRNTHSATPCNSRIRGQKATNPGVFVDIAGFDARVWTTEYIHYVVPAMTAGVYYTTDDFKAVIQEIIDQPGWASGQAMVIAWDDWEERSSDANREVYSYNGSTTTCPQLKITYSDPPPPAVGGQGGPAALVAAGII